MSRAKIDRLVAHSSVASRCCKDRCPLAEDRVALTRQVKEASDIVVVVGAYLPLTPAGAIFKAICPFHNDSRPSLDIDPRRQRYRCWTCGKFGDVFSFVMDHEKVDFLEARSILANRAGIRLDDANSPDPVRLGLLESVRFAETQYRECLLESPLAESARIYLGGRRLSGATVRQFGLGFAPATGDWLVRLAMQHRIPSQNLHEVGLIAERKEKQGFYDRFRDRVMFPIRDVRGQTVGFGGRILPGSAYVDRSPKYYNSAETPLFSKSELLYGLDHARHAAASVGYLAVVEGYTDVLMAHQMGIPQVVATMGTALNARHVAQLRRFVPRVVLVFDADAGGMQGVDRALEIFVSQDVELAIATLPDGLDPCDLLAAQGAEPFLAALRTAVDALDFKLNQLLSRESSDGIEGSRRTIDAILSVMAAVPSMTGQSGKIREELLVTRIAHRLRLRQETVWARLGELRDAQNRGHDRRSSSSTNESLDAPRGGPAPPVERQYVELLLADASLVAPGMAAVPAEEITHAGLRRLVDGLYALQQAGQIPDLDSLRPMLLHPALTAKALEMQEVGSMLEDRPEWLRRVIQAFAQRRAKIVGRDLHDQLSRASDDTKALELLRRLQNQQPS